MSPLPPRALAASYLATVAAGFAVFRIEPFGYSFMGLFAVAAASKPLFTALESNERAVGILYFIVLLLSILLAALYGWLALSAALLALKDLVAPSLLPTLSRTSPYLVFSSAALMLLGLTVITIFPGDQPQKLTVNGMWFLIPVLLLGLSAYDLTSRRRRLVAAVPPPLPKVQ